MRRRCDFATGFSGRVGLARDGPPRFDALSPMFLLLLAPLFLAFEVWQLVLSERYLGIKQIARGTDPRTLGLAEVTACIWSLSLIAYWFWMIALLFIPLGR